MARPKMIGFQKTYISNRRADSKKAKAWKRNREKKELKGKYEKDSNNV